MIDILIKVIVYGGCTFGFLLLASIFIIYANKKFNFFSSFVSSISVSKQASQRLDNITRKILSKTCTVEITPSMYFAKITDITDNTISDTFVINPESKFFGCAVTEDHYLVMNSIPDNVSKRNFSKVLTDVETYKSFNNPDFVKYEQMFKIKNERYDGKSNIILE